LENQKSYETILAELEALQQELTETKYQLEEATETLNAIRSGNVDALVVKREDGHHLYTLKSADQSYRIFIEQMTESAVTLNQSGTIQYCNSQFAQLTGVPLEKIIGQAFNQFVPHSLHEESRQLIRGSWMHSGKGELAILSANGTAIPVLLSLKNLELDEGPSLSIILTDLTSQKEAQRLLQQKNDQLEEAHRIMHELNANLEKTVKERTSTLEQTLLEKTKVEHRLTQILETMAEGVGIIDTEGYLSYVNPMAQKILGLHLNGDRENFYTSTKWENQQLDGTPLPASEHPMYKTIQAKHPVYDQEIGIQMPGKERFYISINAAPIFDAAGEVIAVIGTFMDVTHRRKAIQQKDDFISVASHELRTPITTLKASLQLLDRIKNVPSPDMLPRLIDQSNKSLNKVTTLINDLLNASKMAEGQLHLNRSKTALSDIITQSMESLPAQDRQYITVEGDQSLQVIADPDRIEQVATNIINNAFKYADASDGIHILINRENNMAKVTITDKGPGIPAEKLPHLFDRYYRADDKGNQYSGLGLGLYICAEIIKRHGGQIGANSQPGQGSSFWFCLPLE